MTTHLEFYAKCISCNKPFLGHREGQAYCSRKCNIESQKDKYKFNSNKIKVSAYDLLPNDLREMIDNQECKHEEIE